MSKKCTPLWREAHFLHTILGPLLEVDMLKKCTPLWLEAHFEVKSAKNWGLRATFAHWDVFCVAGAGDSAPCQKWAKRKGFVAASTTTTTTLHCTPLQLQLHYITLHYITLHYSSYTPLHSISYTPLHSTPLPTLHSTPLHPTPLHSTPLHSTTLHYNTTLH